MNVINNNQAGFVFENGNDEALLSAAIELVSSEKLRRQLGENSNRLISSTFSVAAAASMIEEKLKV